jgi:hypothetical protein
MCASVSRSVFRRDVVFDQMGERVKGREGSEEIKMWGMVMGM